MTAFDEIKTESQYWTGYKPDLVEKVVERGNELERELAYETKQRKGNFQTGFGEMIGFGAGVGIAVIMIFLFLFGVNADTKRQRIFNYAYELGQKTALSGDIDFELGIDDIGQTTWIRTEGSNVPTLLKTNREWNIISYNRVSNPR